MIDGQKQEWAKQHADRIQKLFEQWQQPLGIDGREYAEYLRKELVQSHDNPLLKELIESIS
jgi:ribosomal protein L32E